MNWNKVVSLVQTSLAMGAASSGSFLIPSIQKGSCRMVVCNENIGANTKKKLCDKTKSYHIPLLMMPEEQFNRISSKAAQAYGLSNPGIVSSIVELMGLDQEKKED